MRQILEKGIKDVEFVESFRLDDWEGGFKVDDDEVSRICLFPVVQPPPFQSFHFIF